MDSSYFNMDSFKEDNIRAVDAKFEAQKIAFAPLCFQAVRAMLELGLLKAIEDSGDDGISRKELSQKTGVSEYGAGILSNINSKIAQVFGYMGQPNFWKITFGNPYLDKLIRTDYVVCTSVSATYGNGSKLEMYKDGIPKVITLQLSFSEVKLKMRNDFAEVFKANEKANNNFVNAGDRYMINNRRRRQIDAATNGANKSIPGE